MPVLFGRRIVVNFAGLTIEKLRINVELERQIDPTQDKGRVTIYNLSREHEQHLTGEEQRGGPLIVQAGYPQTVATLFEGQAQRAVSAREYLSKKTTIHFGDQVHERQRLGAIHVNTIDGPINVRQLATEIIANDMGLTVGPLDAIPADATHQNWYWSGPATVALTTLLAPLGCTWFDADGVVRINCAGRTQPDAPTIQLSPETGLIAAPIRTDEGAEVRMFLNARVVLGSILNIKSDNLVGPWKVVTLRHNADSWDGKFETFCDLRAL